MTPSLPFSIGHAILAATTTKAPHADPEFIELITPRSPQLEGQLSPQQRKQHALAIARKMTEMGYDEEWLSNPKNRAIVEAKIPDMIVDRPAAVIGMSLISGLSCSKPCFTNVRVLYLGEPRKTQRAPRCYQPSRLSPYVPSHPTGLFMC